jgi:hypothetical protein
LKRILVYGAVGGVLIALLKLIEYQHFVRAYPAEIYGGLLAVIFTAVGAYLGLKWTRPKEVVVVREIRVPEGGPFVLNTANLRQLGITRWNALPNARRKGPPAAHDFRWTSRPMGALVDVADKEAQETPPPELPVEAPRNTNVG